MKKMIFKHDTAKKCAELVYTGWHAFQQGSYDDALNSFEQYFSTVQSPKFNDAKFPKSLQLVAHHCAAVAYACRDGEESDRKKAISSLQALLRSQKATNGRELKQVMRTLKLMSELHKYWGRVAGSQLKTRQDLKTQFIRQFTVQSVEQEEFQMFKFGSITI